MYVRGCVERAGRQTSLQRPAANRFAVLQTTVVPLSPARTMFVATTSSETVEAPVNRNRTTAASRKPSPFGLTVVRSALAPAEAAPPFVTCRSARRGPGADSAAAARRNGAIIDPRPRLQFPYFALTTGTIGASILSS